MSKSKYYFGLSLFLVTILANVDSSQIDQTSVEPVPISCYACNSEYDPRCGDPFDPFSIGIINCSLREPLEHLPNEKPRICRKNVQKVYGKIRIVRGCGYIEDQYKDAKCLHRSGTFNVYARYCSCSGNLCNSAEQVTSALLLIAFTTIAAFL